MKLISYLKDKYKELITYILSIFIIIILLSLFKVNQLLIFFIVSILFINFIILFIFDYIRRKLFYKNIKDTLDNLDQKYLITEMIKEPSFIDGKLFLEYLYEINKSMIEYINKYKISSSDFIEYIELWCHEIKTPIATTELIIENNKNEITKSIKEEINKIDNFIEQVLYYARSGNVEKDYIIKKINLKDIVDSVVKRNKKNLISKKIKIEISDLSIVDTDSKWIEFILNQVLINSIKYSKEKNSTIKIYSNEFKNNVILYIEDNGIGIESSEIDKVFDKGFTGTNGRKKYKSTGIGLYLCKKLCNKLGHNITLTSKINEGTKVMIVFPKNSMIESVR